MNHREKMNEEYTVMNEGVTYIRGAKTNIRPITVNQMAKPILKPKADASVHANKNKKI